MRPDFDRVNMMCEEPPAAWRSSPRRACLIVLVMCTIVAGIPIRSRASDTTSKTVSQAVTPSTSGSKSRTVRITTRTIAAEAGTCVLTVTPATQSIAASGGAASVAITAASNTCRWTATSHANWITIEGAASGIGSGTVTYTAAAMPAGAGQTGTITVAATSAVVNKSQVLQPPGHVRIIPQ